ncbi:selenide, water dikinase SelD [Aminipila sp.]|uniref:selenide, water dikinase SelD n=1 Tax=Aminipila sp. TaxID=2060095 RepID=UPI00289F500D|nr:selenide, water dikinase SelD [Aminipila sp.]
MKPDISVKNVKLTQLSKSAGCAAKLEPGVLSRILDKLPKIADENLIVGTETSDDAAVYKISEEIALVQTLDFFPPMVDDPYIFGQIAAANALSDIYAMGGNPITALNIVAYPSCLGEEVLGEILRGGADKVREAGASIAGGHSINDEEPKYGLSVTGIVNPKKILRNYGAQPGDVLILTKPLGCGLINTAVKAGMASFDASKEAIMSMTALNKKAKEVFGQFNIHSCTDVTGFGLAGHALEMASASGVSFEIDTKRLPVFFEALNYARMGLVPEGTYRNHKFVSSKVEFGFISEEYKDLVCDPQTSGGLLVSVEKEHSEDIIKNLHQAMPDVKLGIIGKVFDKKEKYITFL